VSSWRRTSTSSTTDDQAGDGLLEVGRILRPHALAGEVVVQLVTNRLERVQKGSTLLAAGRELRVERSKPFKGMWLVSFEQVRDIETAERLRGVSLFAEPLPDPEALWVHDLVGASVRSTEGEELGNVTGVLANPASDLIELEGGSLIPARFVVEHGPGWVVVDVPQGLIE
jgi:16S rRNA processing protein RimM